MSQWQPQQYDPRQHRRRMQREPDGPPPWPAQYGYGSYTPPQAPPPSWQPATPQHRRRSRTPLYAGIAALVIIAGGGAAYALAGHAGTAARPLTCKQQYARWKTGPAHAAGEQLKTDASALSSAGSSDDITAMTAGLKAVGADAAALEAYPMPACADPAGYWRQYLAAMKAAGDNAGSAAGLGGLLLAEAPLKKVHVIQGKLTAELKRTAGA